MISQERLKRMHQIGPLTYQQTLRDYVVELRPHVVVETGVYHGVSTIMILDALTENNRGHLHSCDPRYRDQSWAEGALARAHKVAIDFTRWTFHGSPSHLVLPKVPSPWDVFLHDSDHSAENMTWELDYAWERLRPGGLLVCDDWQWPRHAPHGAFERFCEAKNLAFKTHSTAAFAMKTG